MNNPMQMINDFNRFRNEFKGDPKEAVEKMIASGQISQQELNRAQAMASEFQRMLDQMNIRF